MAIPIAIIMAMGMGHGHACRELRTGTIGTPEKGNRPDDTRPPGESLFSTLFYVAASSGKSPRQRLWRTKLLVRPLPVNRQPRGHLAIESAGEGVDVSEAPRPQQTRGH